MKRPPFPFNRLPIPTREGRRFILATALVAMAAFNTGNNLIYLILAMMLSILCISVVAPVINLRKLELTVKNDGPIYAKRAASVGFGVKNSKRLSSYSLRLHVRGKEAGTVLHVRSSSEQWSSARVCFDRRGIYGQGDFAVRSGFPFIFFTLSKKVKVSGDVVVYPEIFDGIEALGALGGGGDARSFGIRPGHSDELLKIREWRYGDDMKRISWKTSARAGGLMVRENSEESPGRLTVVLDDIRPLDEAAFESAVSTAASVCKRLIEDGFRVRLLTSSGDVPFGGGPEHLTAILERLSVIKERDTDEYQAYEAGGILILKSNTSALKKFATSEDAVIYAPAI